MNGRIEMTVYGWVFDMQMIVWVMDVFAFGSRALTYRWLLRNDNNPPVSYQEELKLGKNDSIASEWS